MGKECRCQHGALDVGAGIEDFRILGRAFDTPIGRVILVVAVLVALAVGLVVPFDIAHRVGQGISVVRRGVVDGGPRAPRPPVEKIARSGKSRREVLTLAGVAPPEAPQPVAESIVPFGETRWVLTELIAARTDVPGLRNQLDAREDRILAQRVEEPGAGIEAVQLAPERYAEIEAESVDMERRDPVAQRIHHHLQYARMGQIERVAGAGVVDTTPAIVLNQAIIARVVEPAERQRRTELAAFRRMVVDDV